MADTQITFTESQGTILANLAWLPVTANDTITFVPNDGPSPFLTFSPDLAAILTPAPVSPVLIEQGAVLTYTFTSSNPGAYLILVAGYPEATAETPGGASTNLFFDPVPMPEPMPVGSVPPPFKSGS
jgi:hypothetical protein